MEKIQKTLLSSLEVNLVGVQKDIVFEKDVIFKMSRRRAERIYLGPRTNLSPKGIRFSLFLYAMCLAFPGGIILNRLKQS